MLLGLRLDVPGQEQRHPAGLDGEHDARVVRHGTVPVVDRTRLRPGVGAHHLESDLPDGHPGPEGGHGHREARPSRPPRARSSPRRTAPPSPTPTPGPPSAPAGTRRCRRRGRRGSGSARGAGSAPRPGRRDSGPSTAGSGPVSTTTAEPGPAWSTRPSPWPTSQTTRTQPAGAQGSLRGWTTSRRVRRAAPRTGAGWRATRGATRAASAQSSTRADSPRAVGPSRPRRRRTPPPGAPPPGSSRPPSRRGGPAGGRQEARPGRPVRPRRPRTVAGATATPAARFAATATRLT